MVAEAGSAWMGFPGIVGKMAWAALGTLAAAPKTDSLGKLAVLAALGLVAGQRKCGLQILFGSRRPP